MKKKIGANCAKKSSFLSTFGYALLLFLVKLFVFNLICNFFRCFQSHLLSLGSLFDSSEHVHLAVTAFKFGKKVIYCGKNFPSILFFLLVNYSHLQDFLCALYPIVSTCS